MSDPVSGADVPVAFIAGLVSCAAASRPGIAVHQAARLTSADVRYVDDIPVTGPARTLLDLAARATQSEFEQAFDEAVFRKRVKPHQIEDVLRRNDGQPGAPRLRELFKAEQENQRNRLEAERRMAALIKAARLPEPRPNARVGSHMADFLWPGHRVIIEMDGFATHGKRNSFEADRARDAELGAQGYSVLRFTWRQITRALCRRSSPRGEAGARRPGAGVALQAASSRSRAASLPLPVASARSRSASLTSSGHSIGVE